MKILITGMSGLIGRALRAELAADHELTAFNRSQVDGVRNVNADLSNFDALVAAAADQDIVIHLAAKAGENYSWDELRDTNVEGTRHVFEAAVRAGVPRVVFASSGATVAGYERDEPYRSLVTDSPLPDAWPMLTVDTPVRPAGIYGSTKVWGEALAQHFADTTDSRFVCVRIGYVNEEDAPSFPRARSVWCSQRDVVDALKRAALESLSPKCARFFAGSANARNYRDLEHGRDLLGFVPSDGAD
ncbi:MAG: NAD(P)-dependent oxidoreductase [Pseudomonadota bacterium]